MFDLDGVLIDSEPVREHVRRVYVEENRGRWPADAQDRLMGMSTSEWAHYLSDEAGVGGQPEEVATAVVERMAERMAERYAEDLPLIRGSCSRRSSARDHSSDQLTVRVIRGVVDG